LQVGFRDSIPWPKRPLEAVTPIVTYWEIDEGEFRERDKKNTRIIRMAKGLTDED
jgi:hypothetical protein